jgi:hypothetical protein
MARTAPSSTHQAPDVAPQPGRRADLHLIFPPQWSPFQPFLSTPSLKAYLEERGHNIHQDDWNLAFYQWFVSHERLPFTRARLLHYARKLTDESSVYRAKCLHALTVLDEHEKLLTMANGLKGGDTCDTLASFKDNVDALRRLLSAFSTAEPVITVGTHSLTHGGVLHSVDSLLEFIDDRHANPFIEFFERQVAGITQAPRYFGISIIGGEQIIAGMTLGRILKRVFPDSPVLVGGSVFSRLVEKEKATIVRLFDTCFDYICLYEGEKPMDLFLSSKSPRRDRTPNLAFLEDDNVVMTPLCEQLPMEELPTPDFSNLPLDDYLSPNVVLPLLTTRGCYWGKCAFCYHGMIYGDRYRMRAPAMIARDVQVLNERYGAQHFAFNDEALPPKLFRLLPEAMPRGKYFFTALYKFEKVFKPEDYRNMYEIGFRSLYIGLESASERMQRKMLKNNTQKVMVDNLQFAHDAGIWNHTFNFFGFPTETEEDAEETTQFLLNHADILHSEGTGTFSFEHNAPVHKAPDRFSVKSVSPKTDSILNLFYDYEPESGLDAEGAHRALERFTKLKRERGVYKTGHWIAREHLLLLLSRYGRDELRRQLLDVESAERTYPVAEILRSFTVDTPEGPRYFVVNRHLGRVCSTNQDTLRLVEWLSPKASVTDLVELYPVFAPLLDHNNPEALVAE